MELLTQHAVSLIYVELSSITWYNILSDSVTEWLGGWEGVAASMAICA
jgi:hypothetical protein